MAKGAQRKKDYVVAEYHSVFSRTGTFMVRQGDLKLVVYSPAQPDEQPYPPQLFNLTKDPWEHNNLAPSSAADVKRLQALLSAEIDMDKADAAKKAFDKHIFDTYWYTPEGGAKKCSQFMAKVYKGFDPAADGAKVAKWLGKPCPK